MPNANKSANAPKNSKVGTSVSSRLTKAELIQIISTGHIDPPLTYDEFYRCAIATVSRWCVRVKEGSFASTLTDDIKSTLDTLCRIYRNR